MDELLVDSFGFAAGISTIQEPLVAASSQNYRRHRGRRRRTRGGGTQQIELSTYRPPEIPTVDGRYVSTGAAMRSVANPVLNQKNPAEDLSFSLCSHGLCCVQCVRTQEIGISENCGAFSGILGPGLHLGLWPWQRIAARISLRVQQLDVTCETKTIDNVFVFVNISVQFRILVTLAYDAFYTLADPKRQIQTYVYDVVRSAVPRMTLDQLFTSKSEISDSLFTRLQAVMKTYGYEIVETLTSSISPNNLVKCAMNEVNVSRRVKEAMPYRAEAGKDDESVGSVPVFKELPTYLSSPFHVVSEKVRIIKEAEGRAETLRHEGVGTANQRRAIAQGITASVMDWSSQNTQHTSKDVMDLLLLTQYLDTLSAVGNNGAHLMMRYSPGEILAIKQALPTREQKSPPDLLW
jgi:regulator of protease activity HflC (stomatin/prohibitin superfamily)